MKRLGAALFLMLILLTGCSSPSQAPVYHVMFDGTPNLFDSAVYFNGQKGGEIVSHQAVQGVVHQVTVSISPEFMDRMRTGAAFCISSGGLHYEELTRFGDPLPLGEPVLGFHSKAGLYGFRLTHLMKPIQVAAAERARDLFGTGN